MDHPKEPAVERELPAPNGPGGRYIPVLIHNGCAYVSGHLPKVDAVVAFTGKVGDDCSVEDARAAARLCALACLSSLNASLGSLDAIVRVLKVTGFVASAPGFNRQSGIVDAASDLLVDYLGSRGEGTRTSRSGFSPDRIRRAAVPPRCPTSISRRWHRWRMSWSRRCHPAFSEVSPSRRWPRAARLFPSVSVRSGAATRISSISPTEPAPRS